MKRSTLAIILGMGLLYSCSNKNDLNLDCVGDPVMTNGAFRVVDQNTGTDLFFSDNPKYSLKDIYAFKTSDKARHDTIKPIVYGKGSFQAFVMPLDFSKPKDTLILKIGNTPDDKFIYTTTKGTSPCSVSILDKVYLNSVEATYIKDQNVYILKKP